MKTDKKIIKTCKECIYVKNCKIKELFKNIGKEGTCSQYTIKKTK